MKKIIKEILKIYLGSRNMLQKHKAQYKKTGKK